jgi:hypothetical protein
MDLLTSSKVTGMHCHLKFFSNSIKNLMMSNIFLLVCFHEMTKYINYTVINNLK